MHRKPKASVRQQPRVRQQVREEARASDACAFFNLLTGPLDLQRIYSRTLRRQKEDLTNRLFATPIYSCRIKMQRPGLGQY